MTMRDALTAAMFQRNDEGQTVMYPNGVLGRGYVVPNPDAERRMRQVLMWLVITAGVAGGVGVSLLQAYFGGPADWAASVWLIVLAALAGLGLAYRLFVARLASGLTPVEARLGLLDAFKRQAVAMPRWYLILLAIFSPLMVAGSVYGLVAGPAVSARVLGCVGVALFGVTTAQAIHGLRQKR